MLRVYVHGLRASQASRIHFSRKEGKEGKWEKYNFPVFTNGLACETALYQNTKSG